LRTVWPRVRIRADAATRTLALEGLASVAGLSLGDLYRLRRQQLGLLRLAQRYECAPPAVSQGDYLLSLLLQRRLPAACRTSLRGGRALWAAEPGVRVASVFALMPACRLDHMRAMGRFLSGLEDFARVHGHYRRCAATPALQLAPHYRRMCLICFLDFGLIVLDSEWHFLFGCPSCSSALGRLVTYGAEAPASPSAGAASRLVSLLWALRDDSRKLGDFASALWLALRCRQRRLDALPYPSLERAIRRHSAGSAFLSLRAARLLAGRLADLIIAEAAVSL
jgi:hypothetical protein